MHLATGLGVLGLALGCAALPEVAAAADLLRCTGPDGRTIFTDDKSVCPEAKPYEPSGSVQSVSKPQAPRGETSPSSKAPDAPAAPGPSAKDAQAAEAEHWRERKRLKQDELRQLMAEQTHLKSYVTFCNDGHTVFTRDAAGVKEKIPCSQLHARLDEIDAQTASLRNYIENELPEECRRAGCLPGWIR